MHDRTHVMHCTSKTFIDLVKSNISNIVRSILLLLSKCYNKIIYLNRLKYSLSQWQSQQSSVSIHHLLTYEQPFAVSLSAQWLLLPPFSGCWSNLWPLQLQKWPWHILEYKVQEAQLQVSLASLTGPLAPPLVQQIQHGRQGPMFWIFPVLRHEASSLHCPEFAVVFEQI